ncbi:MAG: serine hydrolase [Actinomycetes bacterium]
MPHDVAAALATAPGVRWGVALRDAATDELLLGHAADDVLPTASVGKLLLLVAAARRDGDALLQRDSVAPVADSGLWQHLHVETLPLHDCAALVGAVSDNLATNVLLAHVGLTAVDAVADELGLADTRLHDAVRDVRGPEHPPTLSTGTAAELTALLARLHRDEVDGARQVLRWLAPGADLSMVAAAFGLDPLAHVAADRGLRVVAKTGTDRGLRADVGLASGPAGTVAYAVLAHWDDDVDRRDDVLEAMRAIGRVVRRHVE